MPPHRSVRPDSEIFLSSAVTGLFAKGSNSSKSSVFCSSWISSWWLVVTGWLSVGSESVWREGTKSKKSGQGDNKAPLSESECICASVCVHDRAPLVRLKAPVSARPGSPPDGWLSRAGCPWGQSLWWGERQREKSDV